jgi:carboxyl-terminal processing protease
MRVPRLTLRLAVLAAFLVTACTPQQAFTPRLTSDVPETPTPAVAADSSTASRAELSAEEGLAVIRQAFVVLLDAHVDALDPAALLRAAWDGFSAALPAAEPRPEPPALTGTDPAGDLSRFRTAYLAAAAPAGGGREGQAALAHAAVRRMAESLGELRFGGVGIRIKRRPNEPLVVWELLDGGTAAKAGIKPGDAILKVDGQETAPLSLDQIAGMIRGPEGSQVRLTVERADGKKVQDVSLKRVQIAEPAFRSKWLAGNIGYLRLFGFSQSGQGELLQAMREFEAKSPKGWIIDLRTNGGGELPLLLSLLSKFLKEGPFGYEIDKQGRRAALGPDGSYLARQHPIVVLVSDSTSSAAELFARAVQHYQAATVVGTKTAGCVGIANRFPLPDGSQISVTVRKLLGPDGEELNRAGVVPNEVVEVSRTELAAGKDPQLQRALRLLGAPAG